MKKTLLITGSKPDCKGVGDIFLKSVLLDCDKSSFYRVSILKKDDTTFERFWCGIPSKVLGVTKTHIPLLSSLLLAKFKFFELIKIKKELENLIEKESIERVWFTLSSPEVILLANKLQKECDIPTFSTIWDIPEYLVNNLNLDIVSAKSIYCNFKMVLDKSEKISVIDEGMRDYLPASLHKKILIIRNGIEFKKASKTVEKNTKKLKIVFAGSLYAKKEWNSLVCALRKADFKINNKEVELICIGTLPRFGIIKDSRIKFMGYLPNEEVLSVVSECDVGYVPYWFDIRKAKVVQTSFPGKVSSYVATGIKVFFHGPTNSTVTRFLDNYNVGLSCPSLELDALISALSIIDNKKKSLVDYDYAKAELSVKSMKDKFNCFL